MAEHTPGPWYAGGPMNHDNYVVQTRKGAIAHVHPPNAEADARLIAAAPDLSSAAIAALNSLRGQTATLEQLVALGFCQAALEKAGIDWTEEQT